MKRIIILILMSLLNASIFAQVKYPSRDSKEWNNLTVAQRWQAVNIPEDSLPKMSTIELIDHCLNFNFMWDIFNHPNYEIGLNVVIENHNGLRELLNRKDAGELILEYYQKINLEEVVKMDEPADRGKFVGKVFFLELFLSYPNIMNQFQGNEQRVIAAILQTYDRCLKINEENERDYYCGYSIGTKIMAIGRGLDHLNNRETTDMAIEDLDLSKLTDEHCRKIIEEARKL